MSPRTADVVVVGAGVMGASIAFQLSRRRAGRVLVLDKGDVASGGSGRSSALVRMHYSHEPEVALAKASYDIFVAWPGLLGLPTHFRKTGFIRLVPEARADASDDERAREQLASIYADQRQADRLSEVTADMDHDDLFAGPDAQSIPPG